MEKITNPNVIVVLPAYNAEKTLKKTLDDIPKNIVDEIILVDDCSQDSTVELSKKLNITTIKHKENLGYGGNQKTCYRTALNHGADIVIMVHPDYQYDPKAIKYMVNLITENYCDVVLGCRIRSKREAFEGGMPWYRYSANRFMSTIESFLSGYTLSDWHSGMRAYKREVLENIDFENFSNNFVFDSQMLFKIIEKGYRIGETPIPIRYFKESSSINIKESLRYVTQTLGIALKFFLRRMLNLQK